MSIKYHFFGKDCLIDRALQDCSNLNKLLLQDGFKFEHEPVFVNQVHSAEVIVLNDIKKIHTKDQRPKADAIVTNIKNLPIAIQTADCLPILLFDEINSVIAVVHAGWRGAKAGIIENAINKMLEIGADIKNIKAIIGPAIQQNSYQISEDFYQDFIAEKSGNKKFFIKCDNDATKYLFDLPAYAEENLVNKGVGSISNEKIDTYGSVEKLFSYRRSSHLGELDYGRNISIIILN